MSATPTQNLEGTQAPNQIELLWERYRSLVYVIVVAVLGAIVVTTGLRYLRQKEIDREWSTFATSVGLEKSYGADGKPFESLTECLDEIDPENLAARLQTASDKQKPFLLLALARRAMLDKQWDAAEARLREIETRFPQHTLVVSSQHPVQVQDVVRQEDDQPAQPRKKPEYEPAVSGSAVSLMRAQIEAAKAYAPPEQFARPEIPTDAKRIKFELSGGYGEFVVALLPNTPVHQDAILKLAADGFWKDIAIDEIRRPTKFSKQPHELHFGFESTKESDRDKWKTTDPSKHILEFETTNLSHFAGAVSARIEADGKSCADRLWVAVDDAPQHDGSRVIVGFVVEGLENLKRVCEASMTAQEEERGQGRPSENIRITAVTVP